VPGIAHRARGSPDPPNGTGTRGNRCPLGGALLAPFTLVDACGWVRRRAGAADRLAAGAVASVDPLHHFSGVHEHRLWLPVALLSLAASRVPGAARVRCQPLSTGTVVRELGALSALVPAAGSATPERTSRPAR
jgi:hypothetical protein